MRRFNTMQQAKSERDSTHEMRRGSTLLVRSGGNLLVGRGGTFAALLVALLLCVGGSMAHAYQTVRYPSPGENFKRHHVYPLALLRLALSKQYADIRLQPSKDFMQQGRAIKQLGQHQDIEVMWTMTSVEREHSLLPIRIPIYRGLIGWRVFLTGRPALINRAEAPTLETLRGLSLIQGHDWPDTQILRHNGFKVFDSPSYAGLFDMIALGRADLFPRSVIEVWDELELVADKGVALEPNTLIRYPTASYFFVAPGNTELAQMIESGLNKALSDGSFQALFKHYFEPMIERARLDQRTLYTLDNPLLSEATPTERPELWFSIGEVMNASGNEVVNDAVDNAVNGPGDKEKTLP